MKTWQVLILLASISFSFTAQGTPSKSPIIISGFDDVIRQANNTSLLGAALKLFNEDLTYTGMPEFYRLYHPSQRSFYVLSAISWMFKDRALGTLQKYRYPPARLHLRSWLTQWFIVNFKLSEIEKIISNNSQREFLIIFDNSFPSIDLARKMRKKYPKKILDIYLRQTVEKETPKEAISFYTAFDLAWHEFQKKRIDQNELMMIGEIIFNEKNEDKIIPSYAHCPLDYNPCPNGNNPFPLCLKIQKKLHNICKKR